MKKTLSIFTTYIFLLACSPTGNTIKQELFTEAFPGFLFSTASLESRPTLSGYEYQSTQGDTLAITSCEQANDLELSQIAEYDYFRFRLLLVSCTALDKYREAQSSYVSYFPPRLTAEFVNHLPAAVIPLLSSADAKQKRQFSVKAYAPEAQVTTENEHSFRVPSKEDDVYLTLLARADFTNDGIEDLLIRSEWYARNAHGKHVDLLVLSKLSDVSETKIAWRLNQLD